MLALLLQTNWLGPEARQGVGLLRLAGRLGQLWSWAGTALSTPAFGAAPKAWELKGCVMGKGKKFSL